MVRGVVAWLAAWQPSRSGDSLFVYLSPRWSATGKYHAFRQLNTVRSQDTSWALGGMLVGSTAFCQVGEVGDDLAVEPVLPSDPQSGGLFFALAAGEPST